MNLSLSIMLSLVIDLETVEGLEDIYFDYEPPVPITREDEAARLLHLTQGRIFGATVLGRNGKVRTFNAKLREDSFDRTEETGLVIVHENNAGHATGQPIRSIALEGVKSLRIDGVTHDLDARFGVLEEAREEGHFQVGDVVTLKDDPNQTLRVVGEKGRSSYTGGYPLYDLVWLTAGQSSTYLNGTPCTGAYPFINLKEA